MSEIKHRTVETNGIHMHFAESGAGRHPETSYAEDTKSIEGRDGAFDRIDTAIGMYTNIEVRNSNA